MNRLILGSWILLLMAIVMVSAHADSRIDSNSVMDDLSDVIEADTWIRAIDTVKPMLDAVHDADRIEVLKQFRRTIDPNRHGKNSGDNLRAALFKMKNTLPEIYNRLEIIINRTTEKVF